METNRAKEMAAGAIFKIIRSSVAGIASCMSAGRFLGQCQDCDRVERCRLPESHKGRIVLAEKRVARVKGELSQAVAKLRQAAGDLRTLKQSD